MKYAAPPQFTAVVLSDGADLDSTTVKNLAELRLREAGVSLWHEGEQVQGWLTMQVTFVHTTSVPDGWWLVARLTWTGGMYVLRPATLGHLLSGARAFKGSEAAFLASEAETSPVLFYEGAKYSYIGGTPEEARGAVKARIGEMLDEFLLARRESTE